MSDFQSVQAMDSRSNAASIAAMVKVLGKCGKVMVAHYQNDSGTPGTMEADLKVIMTDAYLRQAMANGLFAFSFMDHRVLSKSSSLYAVARAAVRRYGGPW